MREGLLPVAQEEWEEVVVVAPVPVEGEESKQEVKPVEE